MKPAAKWMATCVCALLLLRAVPLLAQNQAPAPVQHQRILILGATAHTATGKTIVNSAVAFADGKLTLVADATTIRLDMAAFDTVYRFPGKHIYPGLIAMNTIIGLTEIDAVRSTHDFNEVGSINPSARSIVAFNTDSRIIPTVRSNGVLLAQVVPVGGLIPGQSSVVHLDAWNYEDALVKGGIGMELNWPSMRVVKSPRVEPDDKQQEKNEKELVALRQLFTDARAYAGMQNPAPVNLNLRAMKGLFDGTMKLYVHCDYVKEIVAAAGFCREFGVQMVLVGGADAWMVKELLRDSNIPVVLTNVDRLPSRTDEPVDLPYRLPFLLQQAGVKVALAVNGSWQIRSLAFQAGTAGGYGFDPEMLLQSVTIHCAEILGIADRTGTLETGKDATLIVCDGDLFDMRTSEVSHAWIEGRALDLDTMQKQLYRKYQEKYHLE